MKRDMDLVRQILLDLSETDESLEASVFVTKKWDENLVGYNMVIMAEAGLINITRSGTLGNPYYYVCADSLTWEGNEFLSAVKNEGVWSKVKKKVAKTASDAPLEVFKTLAIKTLTELMS